MVYADFSILMIFNEHNNFILILAMLSYYIYNVKIGIFIHILSIRLPSLHTKRT